MKLSEKTLVIIKPDSVQNGNIGNILVRFEKEGFIPLRIELKSLSREFVTQFYYEHKDRNFFGELIDFLTEGPVVVCVFEGEKAIERCRQLIGMTDPKKSPPGTIRRDFAESIDRNAIHGSDSSESATREIGLFFVGLT